MNKIELSSDTLAQLAHIGWGAAIVLAFAMTGHPFIGGLVMEGIATFKETVFDPLTETKAMQGSGLEDWAFWNLGIGLALGFVLFLRYVVHTAV